MKYLKTLFATTALLCAVITAYSTGPVKKIDRAKSLSGLTDKLAEARKLVGEAKEDSLVRLNPYLWYVAGKIEYDAYNASKKRLMVNPNAGINKSELATQLDGIITNWKKALALDSLPDAKGKVKLRYTKEITRKLKDLQNDYFSMGNYFYGEKKFYPQSYRMYSGFASLPEIGIQVTDSLLPKAALNASLAAYNARQYNEAIESLRKTRAFGDVRPQTYFYEIAAWRALAQEDSIPESRAREIISALSLEGYEKYGLSEPFFLRNYVNMELLNHHDDQALMVVEEAMEKYPPSSEIYGMAARINQNLGNKERATEYFRLAADRSDASPEILKSAARSVFVEGNDIWKTLVGSDSDTQNRRNEVIENYFKKALEYAERAKAVLPDDIEVNTLLENINYVLLTGF